MEKWPPRPPMKPIRPYSYLVNYFNSLKVCELDRKRLYTRIIDVRAFEALSHSFALFLALS